MPWSGFVSISKPLLIKINSLLELRAALHIYKQAAFWERGLESQSEKGGGEVKQEGLRLLPSLPSPGRASLNQCVIAISRKVPFALNRADKGRKGEKKE